MRNDSFPTQAENLYIGWKPNWMKRPDAAVSLFIALSGFCAHWAHADKITSSPSSALTGATLPFWVGRFLKTAFMYYLAHTVSGTTSGGNTGY